MGLSSATIYGYRLAQTTTTERALITVKLEISFILPLFISVM